MEKLLDDEVFLISLDIFYFKYFEYNPWLDMNYHNLSFQLLKIL